MTDTTKVRLSDYALYVCFSHAVSVQAGLMLNFLAGRQDHDTLLVYVSF